METKQKKLYLRTIAHALALACGPRDEDYNKGGIGLRDYWEINGILSPLQMVDMKVKRARSLLGSWNYNGAGRPLPRDAKDVAKVLESMADAINYASFVVCEALSLYEDSVIGKGDKFDAALVEIFSEGNSGLASKLETAIQEANRVDRTPPKPKQA